MRRAEGVPALVLRRTEYGDSDLILGLYCRGLGRLSALARSARRSQKRFGGALGLFTVSEVELSARPRSEMWTLQSANVTGSYAAIGGDVASVAHGSYALELVRELTGVEQEDDEIFDLLVELFASLASAGPRAGRLRVFEMHLLKSLGLAPVFECCCVCGSEALADAAVHDPARGGVVCARCAGDSRGAGVRPISDAARHLLMKAGGMARIADGDALDELAGAIEARACMLTSLYHHVGKPLKSVEFIAKLRNSR